MEQTNLNLIVRKAHALTIDPESERLMQPQNLLLTSFHLRSFLVLRRQKGPYEVWAIDLLFFHTFLATKKSACLPVKPSLFLN